MDPARTTARSSAGRCSAHRWPVGNGADPPQFPRSSTAGGSPRQPASCNRPTASARRRRTFAARSTVGDTGVTARPATPARGSDVGARRPPGAPPPPLAGLAPSTSRVDLGRTGHRVRVRSPRGGGDPRRVDEASRRHPAQHHTTDERAAVVGVVPDVPRLEHQQARRRHRARHRTRARALPRPRRAQRRRARTLQPARARAARLDQKVLWRRTRSWSCAHRRRRHWPWRSGSPTPTIEGGRDRLVSGFGSARSRHRASPARWAVRTPPSLLPRSAPAAHRPGVPRVRWSVPLQPRCRQIVEHPRTVGSLRRGNQVTNSQCTAPPTSAPPVQGSLDRHRWPLTPNGRRCAG